MKIIGWGEEPGNETTPALDYWLVVNAWSEEWGDGGLFKIRRGNNECGIEEKVAAGEPDTSHRRSTHRWKTDDERTGAASCDITPLGCYTDVEDAALNISRGSWSMMDAGFCASLCQPHKIFGMRNGTDCWCGDAIGANATMEPDDDCDVPCAGNASQTCGAAGNVDVFSCESHTVCCFGYKNTKENTLCRLPNKHTISTRNNNSEVYKAVPFKVVFFVHYN